MGQRPSCPSQVFWDSCGPTQCPQRILLCSHRLAAGPQTPRSYWQRTQTGARWSESRWGCNVSEEVSGKLWYFIFSFVNLLTYTIVLKFGVCNFVFYFFIINKLIHLFSNDASTWLEITVKLQNISISNKYCSFELSVHPRILKKIVFPQNIKQHNCFQYW